jgi:hypothetical protein
MNRIAALLGLLLLAPSCCLGQHQESQRSLGDVARESRAQKDIRPTVTSQKADAATELPLVPIPQQNLKANVDFALYVSRMLHAQQFDELDTFASNLRASKERYHGGIWKLFTFYYGLETPWPDRYATEDDWQTHINLLEQWVERKPASVTARVALAQAYTGYAWVARGSGYADKVTESGWKLFAERNAKARSILEDAAKLQEKCPEWFFVMQKVALGEGWNRIDEKRLFERAIAFEPDYVYFYREHANFLLPKWNGEEGEAVAFANSVAKRLGPDQGDIVYFDLAWRLTMCCSLEEMELSNLSWPRIQNGFALLEKRYGPDAWRLNQLAYLAMQLGDAVTVNKALKRLEGNWDQTIWGTKKYYDSIERWAEEKVKYDQAMLKYDEAISKYNETMSKYNEAMASSAQAQAEWMAKRESQVRAMTDAANANLKIPGGQAYVQSVQDVLTGLARKCMSQTRGKEKFTLFLSLRTNGTVQEISDQDSSPMAVCLMNAASSSYLPKAPHDQYWIKFEFDPTNVDGSLSK